MPWIGLVGMVVIIGIALAFSHDRKAIRWRTVGWSQGPFAREQFIDRLLPERDLLVAILRARSQFHPVQRALARQRFLQFLPARQDAEDRIFPQLLVIVDVFVSQRQTVDPLGQHLQNGVLDLLLIPKGLRL